MLPKYKICHFRIYSYWNWKTTQILCTKLAPSLLYEDNASEFHDMEDNKQLGAKCILGQNSNNIPDFITNMNQISWILF